MTRPAAGSRFAPRRGIILGALGLLCASTALASTKAATMHYLKALLFQRQGDYAHALQEYETAVQLDPQSGYIMEQAAELALEAGQADRALDLAERLIGVDPKNPKARLLSGNIHWARGDLSRAQRAFEDALRIDPKHSDALFALGNLLNAQSPEKARRYFQDYLSSSPERPAEAYYQMALVDVRLGRTQAAMENLRAAIRMDPQFVQARYSLAHLYESRRDTEAALGEYLAILDREPDNVALLNHVGELYFLRGEADAAAGHFLKAKASAPNNPGSCLWLAMLAEAKGDFAGAARHLSESAALKEDAELHLRQSYYLTQANRLKEALDILETARGKWPDNDEIAYFLALGYDDTKEYGKAIVLLQDVLRRRPQSRDARFQVAALYEKLNKMPEAEREFRVLLEQRPRDAAALNYLGYSFADRGLKLGEAEELIRGAVSLDPDNGAYRDSLGWVFFKQGRAPEALAELSTALRLLPDDGTLWEHMGDIRESLGEADAAWLAWKTAAMYDPPGDRINGKIAGSEKGLPPARLGERLMEFMRRTQDSLAEFSGSCEISGAAFGKTFAFNGLLVFRSGGELRLEVLGPLFVPLFRLSIDSRDNFTMDAVPLEGVSPEALQQALSQSLLVLRDYLGGAVFRERPAQFHRGWRGDWISTATRQLFLSDGRQGVQGVKSVGEDRPRLSLDDFRLRQGRRIPLFLRLEGKGFAIGLHLPSPRIRFEAE